MGKFYTLDGLGLVCFNVVMKNIILILLFSIGFIGVASAQSVWINILKLKSLNSCEDCNLSGADLRDEYLYGANLQGADLSGANLEGADLFADLKEANLSGADLSGADLSNAILDNAKIKDAKFCNTKTPWGVDNSGCIGKGTAEVESNIAKFKYQT